MDFKEYMNAVETIQGLVKERGYKGDFKDLGHIYTQTTEINGKGLVLFNYTPLAMLENTWNEYEVVCRGLILDEDGFIVARPFSKFFNFNQNGMTEEVIRSVGIDSITTKVDGSLGIIFFFDGEWRVATRGSFNSEQSHKAAELMGKYSLEGFFPGVTYLVEIIYPENRIVVDYGKREELILIAGIYNHNGKDLTRFDMELTAAFAQMPLVENSIMGIDGLISSTKDTTGVEGWVALLKDGSRVKFKTDDYKTLHKLIGNITNKNVFEAWATGGIEGYMSAIPDEFLDGVKEFVSNLDYSRNKINTDYRRIYLAITNMVQMITDHTDSTNMRKEFALLALRFKYPSLLFAMLANQDTHKVIVKIMEQDLSQFGEV